MTEHSEVALASRSLFAFDLILREVRDVSANHRQPWSAAQTYQQYRHTELDLQTQPLPPLGALLNTVVSKVEVAPQKAASKPIVSTPATHKTVSVSPLTYEVTLLERLCARE